MSRKRWHMKQPIRPLDRNDYGKNKNIWKRFPYNLACNVFVMCVVLMALTLMAWSVKAVIDMF